jgi:hypothetical protein
VSGKPLSPTFSLFGAAENAGQITRDVLLRYLGGNDLTAVGGAAAGASPSTSMKWIAAKPAAAVTTAAIKAIRIGLRIVVLPICQKPAAPFCATAEQGHGAQAHRFIF